MTDTTAKYAALVERLRAAHPNNEARFAHLHDPGLRARLMTPPPTLDGTDVPDSSQERAPERKRRPLAFTKRDIARAISAHMSAGLSVKRVEIDKQGKITIETGKPEPTSITPANEWDTL